MRRFTDNLTNRYYRRNYYKHNCVKYSEFKFAYMVNSLLPILTAIFFSFPALFFTPFVCFAVERITDDVSDSLDLIDTQNFGSLNLETGEVNIIYDSHTASDTENISTAKTDGSPPETNFNASGDKLRRVTGLEPAAASSKTEEIDLISTLMPEETYEIIGSSAAANPEAEEHFKVGTDLFNQKEYITAKAHFEKAIKLEPANDVYLLALEMVINTMRAQGITEPVKKPETPIDTAAIKPVADGDAHHASPAGTVPETPVKSLDTVKQPAGASKNISKNTHKKKEEHKSVVRTQVFTCYFQQRLPEGNIIFNTGVNTEIKKSDIDGYYVLFDNQKDAMALAAFRLDHEPKKAILIITQKLFADENNFVFPLILKVNNYEALNGAFRLAPEFRPYQFDITGRIHRGFNQILFQTAPFNIANYALLRVEIFIQNF